MNVNKILFPTDFSPCSNQALKEALFLAEQYGAEFHVVHVMLPLEREPDHSLFLPDLASIQKHIDRVRGTAMHPRIPHYEQLTIIRQTLRGISAAETLLRYAQEHDMDVIVLGTHGRRGVRHLVLGSVAEEVVRFSSCPVFSIRETRSDPPHAIQQILVPLDYSEHARNALSHAKSMAADYGATIRALHILEENLRPPFSFPPPASASASFPDLEAAAIRDMKQLFRDAPGPDVPAEFHIREGKAPVDIIGFANRNPIDLIIMASHGLSGIEHFLLGSVAEKVIRMAPCPVFTVKSFGKHLTASNQESILSSEK